MTDFFRTVSEIAFGIAPTVQPLVTSRYAPGPRIAATEMTPTSDELNESVQETERHPEIPSRTRQHQPAITARTDEAPAAKRKRDSAQPQVAKRKRDSAQPQVHVEPQYGGQTPHHIDGSIPPPDQPSPRRYEQEMERAASGHESLEKSIFDVSTLPDRIQPDRIRIDAGDIEEPLKRDAEKAPGVQRGVPQPALAADIASQRQFQSEPLPLNNDRSVRNGEAPAVASRPVGPDGYDVVVDASIPAPQGRVPAVRDATPPALARESAFIERAQQTSAPAASQHPRPEKPGAPIAANVTRRNEQTTVPAAVEPSAWRPSEPLPIHPETPRNTDDLRDSVTPVVRVTIGRIEVRAIMPPAPPPENPARQAPKLSLDEYLRRHNGRRP